MEKSIWVEIKIYEMSSRILGLMLEFMEKREVKFPTDFKVLMDLLDAAQKYEVNILKTLCFLSLFSSLKDENAGELAIAAYKYNLDLESTKMIQNYCKL